MIVPVAIGLAIVAAVLWDDDDAPKKKTFTTKDGKTVTVPEKTPEKAPDDGDIPKA